MFLEILKKDSVPIDLILSGRGQTKFLTGGPKYHVFTGDSVKWRYKINVND